MTAAVKCLATGAVSRYTIALMCATVMAIKNVFKISPVTTVYIALLLHAPLWNVASAQELTPRAYWPLPNGTNVLSVAYQRSEGDILVDPSLPITASVRFNGVLLPLPLSDFGATKFSNLPV